MLTGVFPFGLHAARSSPWLTRRRARSTTRTANQAGQGSAPTAQREGLDLALQVALHERRVPKGVPSVTTPCSAVVKFTSPLHALFAALSLDDVVHNHPCHPPKCMWTVDCGTWTRMGGQTRFLPWPATRQARNPSISSRKRQLRPLTAPWLSGPNLFCTTTQSTPALRRRGRIQPELRCKRMIARPPINSESLVESNKSRRCSAIMPVWTCRSSTSRRLSIQCKLRR